MGEARPNCKGKFVSSPHSGQLHGPPSAPRQGRLLSSFAGQMGPKDSGLRIHSDLEVGPQTILALEPLEDNQREARRGKQCLFIYQMQGISSPLAY